MSRYVASLEVLVHLIVSNTEQNKALDNVKSATGKGSKSKSATPSRASSVASNASTSAASKAKSKGKKK